MKGGLPIVSVQNMYNLGASLVKAMGFQNVDDYLTDPSQAPPESRKRVHHLTNRLNYLRLRLNRKS